MFFSRLKKLFKRLIQKTLYWDKLDLDPALGMWVEIQIRIKVYINNNCSKTAFKVDSCGKCTIKTVILIEKYSF